MDDADLSARHMKAARALLGWDQTRLAQEADVSFPTITRLEALDGKIAETSRASTVSAIRTALEKAGIEFQNGGEPGVRLRKVRRPKN